MLFFERETLSVFFSLVVFLWSGSRPLPFFGKVLFFLRPVCAIHFRGRTFVFALFLGPCVFGVGLPMVFAYFLATSPWRCLKKFSLMSGLVFCLVLSVLGSGLTTSVVVSLLSPFFLGRDTAQG